MTSIRDVIAVSGQNITSTLEHNNEQTCPRDPFARHIIKRIKEVQESVQLTAPDVFGEESFPDANIVAEYIDRTLNEASLFREYEDLSLNNLVLLAELVECAHWSDVLTSGFTVSVPGHCRHRLYYVQNKFHKTTGDHAHNSTLAAETVDDALKHQDEHLSDKEQEISSISETNAASLPPDHSPTISSPPKPTVKRVDGKKMIRNFYRILVMAALVGIVVLFMRLQPEERQENLSRLRNIWTLFSSASQTPGEAVGYPKPAKNSVDSGLDIEPKDTLSDGKQQTQGDFPLPSTPISMNAPSQNLLPEGLATSSSPTEEVSLQPSFVIPGNGDLLQSGPEMLR